MRICKGVLKNGNNCRYRTKQGDFCKIHVPKETCGICYVKNVNFKLDCNHEFCRQCIKKWIKVNNTCPYCRIQVTNNTLKKLKIYNEENNIEEFDIDNNRFDIIILAIARFLIR